VTLNDKRISNEAPQEQISGTTPVAEQLVSSMNVNIPVKSETQQATVVLQENTDVKFGIANATETNLPPKTEHQLFCYRCSTTNLLLWSLIRYPLVI
jgi:phosphodiesterase/alkaline phosphatase D-like protein